MEITLYRLLYRNGYYNRALFENNHNKSSRIGSHLDRFQNAVTRELHVSHDASMFAYLTNLLRMKNTSAPSHRAFIFYFFFPLPLFSDTCLPRMSRSADRLTHRATIPRCATLFRNLTRGEDACFNRGRGYKICNCSCSRNCNHFSWLGSFRTSSKFLIYFIKICHTTK